MRTRWLPAFQIVSFITLFVCMSSHDTLAQEREGLNLLCGSSFSISECKQSYINPILAGGMGRLTININLPLPQGYQPPEYGGISWEWPHSLTIEAGVISDSVWTVIPGLAERMNIRRWNSGTVVWEDSMWRATGREMSSTAKDTSWHFTFVIPEDIVGQQIFFKATYIHTAFGTLVNPIPQGTTSQAYNRLTVVPPCSQKDRDRILGSFVQYTFLSGDLPRTVVLTDSLILLGWRDSAGLTAALVAAGDLGFYQKELEYLDLNYSANGRTNYFIEPASPEIEADVYNTNRQVILRKIEQQQQH